MNTAQMLIILDNDPIRHSEHLASSLQHIEAIGVTLNEICIAIVNHLAVKQMSSFFSVNENRVLCERNRDTWGYSIIDRIVYCYDEPRIENINSGEYEPISNTLSRIQNRIRDFLSQAGFESYDDKARLELIEIISRLLIGRFTIKVPFGDFYHGADLAYLQMKCQDTDGHMLISIPVWSKEAALQYMKL